MNNNQIYTVANELINLANEYYTLNYVIDIKNTIEPRKGITYFKTNWGIVPEFSDIDVINAHQGNSWTINDLKKCECGAEKVEMNYHSTWCPKHE